MLVYRVRNDASSVPRCSERPRLQSCRLSRKKRRWRFPAPEGVFRHRSIHCPRHPPQRSPRRRNRNQIRRLPGAAKKVHRKAQGRRSRRHPRLDRVRRHQRPLARDARNTGARPPHHHRPGQPHSRRHPCRALAGPRVDSPARRETARNHMNTRSTLGFRPHDFVPMLGAPGLDFETWDSTNPKYFFTRPETY